ncbi:hypothetical protein [Paradevosia shaoguanensis]|uniref:Uncharacterized protein n=1 Tax=Paradevosia shaoguanensis TaxID=1335043 RepID=A0AA41QQK8_9HYPH|nr:hypothetical protein [Paradevosia shaoguanensis]MCF1744727.1 hypothetical protein [Paradevosia shaoguanensis]MCI0129210.1 hypothetical protein [Paradevosia shaoguanensis]
MRSLLFCAALLLGGAHATAAEPPCSAESKVPLTVQSWTATPGRMGTEVQVTVKNSSGHALKMNDASLWFTDALGNRVGYGGISIDPDVHLDVGGEAALSVETIGWERLTKADPADFTATICTKSLLTEEGAKLEF